MGTQAVSRPTRRTAVRFTALTPEQDKAGDILVARYEIAAVAEDPSDADLSYVDLKNGKTFHVVGNYLDLAAQIGLFTP